ncbi:MAG: TorF family putative porin [Woeseiaceae bacterium]|nr:TorF family putative porin [Woeseiaceae bacterium]
MLGARIGGFAASLAAILAAAQAVGAEFSGYVTATSDYVRRGVTQSDGGPALQLALDVEFDSGIYAGAWGSTVDIASGGARTRDVESNYYLGYAVDAGERWRIGGNVVWYEYPGSRGSVRYDYVEYSATAGFDDWLWIEFAWSPDFYHSGRATRALDVYAEIPVATNWLVGGGGGYYDVSDFAGHGFGYWQLGVTRVLSLVDVDLRYHDTSRYAFPVSTPDRSDPRLSLSIRYAF